MKCQNLTISSKIKQTAKQRNQNKINVIFVANNANFTIFILSKKNILEFFFLKRKTSENFTTNIQLKQR